VNDGGTLKIQMLPEKARLMGMEMHFTQDDILGKRAN
jgi:hypothetical protein